MTGPTPPPSLPIDRPAARLRLLRIMALGLVQALALSLASNVLGGLTIRDFFDAVLMVAALGILNAVVWPFVIRIAFRLVLWTVGLFTFALNALFVMVAAELAEGVELRSYWDALVIAMLLTLVNLIVGGILHIDGDHVWRSRVARRVAKRTGAGRRSDIPGFLFVQIDGLGHDVLASAMQSGDAPLLSRLVSSGTHTLHRWECDLSSQTGAMQAGILLGDNHNMPAFRWYEKSTGRIMVTNRPKDAADLERRQSSGDGLLVDGGASRANVFSGDAQDSMLTFSSAGDRSVSSSREPFLYVVSTPYALLRVVALMIADIAREKIAYWRAKREGVQPLGHRGGVYPLLRAATTVALAEVTWAILVSDIARGVPSAYVDLVGYDEVAHHSGIEAPDALAVLRRTDDQLERLLTTLDDAPRPYHVVVLADHGQTQGATFADRYGETLEAVVDRLVDAGVTAPVLGEEGWHNVNGLLTDASNDPSSLGQAVRRATRHKTTDGEVAIGPATQRSVGGEHADDVIVLASGNLGLVACAGIDGRATRQQIEAEHPGLIEGLRRHPGIGFLVVRDEVDGDVVLGPAGVQYLDDGRVDGDDPLAVFGPNACDHLRRTSSFDNCPDLLLNSFYDPITDEGAAFEGLIGFHGGLGGRQGHPFVLAPSDLPVSDDPLVGARAIHDLFKGWLRGGADVEARSQPA